MKIKDRIRSLFNRSKSQKVETIIISEKQCPHCANRGMFVFNDTPKIKSKIGESNEKHK
jgi:protein-disulfide isomerase